ncbi:MAG TPA: DUF4388 domain-containing protein, partial [Trichormus sp.]
DVAPKKKELESMCSQASDHRGRDVELTWSEPGATKKYLLTVKMDAGPCEPAWILWEDDGMETKLVWKYQTIDYELIIDVVCMLNEPAAAAAGPALLSTPSAAAAPFIGNALGGGLPGQAQAGGAFAQPSPSGQQPGAGTPLPQPASPPQPSGQGGSPPDPFANSPHQNPSGPGGFPAGHPFGGQQQFQLTAGGYVEPVKAQDALGLEGKLEETKASNVINSIASSRLTGKLELRGDDTTGDIYFVDGVPKHATTASAYGDGAIRELCTWEKGTYLFKRDAKTDMRSVDGVLATIIAEGMTMLDQKRHLKRSGLGYESYLIRKHKQMGDTELKLMLSRGAPIDFAFQRKIWDYLKHKRTFTDLLRDHPMDSTTWTALLFNFLSCGLIEIRAPETVQAGTLDFLGDASSYAQKLAETFIRPETGIYSYPALLLFLQYEYARFQAYNWPLSLVMFEIHRKRADGAGGTDLLAGEASNMAAMRISMIKRPLDTLGHWETLDYGLILPNTSGSSAAWVANRIYESLTATPLGKGLDRNTLSIAFGIASLPADGDDLESLVIAVREAKSQAKTGTFPVVLSRPAKKFS